MICPTCETVIRDCECSVSDSDCIGMDGSGNDTPLAPRWKLDPDENSLLSCEVGGLLAILPLPIRTPPVCCVYNNADISISDSTSTVVTFNSERFDDATNPMHSTSALTSRITFTVPGIYTVRFGAAFAGNTAGDRQAYIRANGRDFLGANQRRSTVSTIESGINVTIQDIFAVSGDYVEALVKQDSGGSLNLLATRYSPVFAAKYQRGLPE